MGNAGTTTAPPGDLAVPEKMLEAGKTLQRIQTRYTTAVAVQEPRNLDKVVANVMREAEYAGEEFYYRWLQKEKQRDGSYKKKPIQGGTIGLAYCIAREWMNCAVECDDVRDVDDAILFFPCFVDLERGVTIQRAFRMGKGGKIYGEYDSERKQDIKFQIAQSKSCRNVIFSGVPRWLIRDAIARAKKAVAEKVTKEGIDVWKKKAVDTFAGWGVTKEQLVEKVGRPMAEWSSEDIADLRGDAEAIRSGEASVEELFPRDEKPPEAAKGPIDPKAAMAAKETAPAAETPQDPKAAPAPTPEPKPPQRTPAPAGRGEETDPLFQQ